MRLFVTGTGTDVGKTVVCGWLCAQMGWPYVKPVQTGARQGRDRDVIQDLANVPIFPETYLYAEPVSPHLAAETQGPPIELDVLCQALALPSLPHLIVEGAGGVLVPLSPHHLMIHLIQKLQRPTPLPILVVAPARLGTINHTLLTLEALASRALPILGVVLTGGATSSPHAEAIQAHSGVPLLAHLPFLPTVSAEVLRNNPLPSAFRTLLESSP